MGTPVRTEAAQTYNAVATALIEATKLIRLAKELPQQWSQFERACAGLRALENLEIHSARACDLAERHVLLFRDAHERLRLSPKIIFETFGFTRSSAHEAAVDLVLIVQALIRHLPLPSRLSPTEVAGFWNRASRLLGALSAWDAIEETHGLLVREVEAASNCGHDNLTDWVPKSVDDLFGVGTAATAGSADVRSLDNDSAADRTATLTVSLAKRTLKLGNREATVEPTPLKLIEYMLSQPDGVADVRGLELTVWGDESERDTRLSTAIKKANHALQAVAARVTIRRSGAHVTIG